MTSNLFAFQVNGNTSAISANSSSNDTQLVIEQSGSTPGAFYVYNSSDAVTFVNITTDATANVVVAEGNQDGRGFPVFRYTPVLVNMNQGYNYTGGNIYITAVTPGGTADIYFTPVA